MTKAESTVVALNLMAALYAAPHHGPAVASILSDGKMLPSLGSGALYAEMLQHGLSSGSLDYAMFNAQAENRNRQDYERLTGEGQFMLSQKTHERDPSMMMAWADMLRENHLNNEIAKDLKSFIRLAEEGNESTADLVGRVIASMSGYVEDDAGGISHIRKACSRALERVQEWKQGVVSDRLLTGFPSVDNILGGLSSSHMSIFAGMTSGFKTAALVELMRRVGLRFTQKDQKEAVVIFSAEMSNEKLVHRLASNISGISQGRVRPINKNTSRRDEDYQKYESAISTVSGLEIYVNQEPNPSFETMYAQCLNIQARMPISFIGFDYIEKMEAEAASEELRVSKIAKNLSALAKQVGPPVVTLSQYSRKSEANAGSLPLNSWLRYSGKVEQEASEIIHWYYPQYFAERGISPDKIQMYNPDDKYRIYAICGKNRDGPLASIPMHVKPETGRFIDPQDSRYQGNPAGEEAPF